MVGTQLFLSKIQHKFSSKGIVTDRLEFLLQVFHELKMIYLLLRSSSWYLGSKGNRVKGVESPAILHETSKKKVTSLSTNMKPVKGIGILKLNGWL